jgi:hypothetical protein
MLRRNSHHQNQNQNPSHLNEFSSDTDPDQVEYAILLPDSFAVLESS